MEDENTEINNPWGKGFRSLIIISIFAFVLSEMWEGMAIIAGLTCFGALFSGFIWLVGMADAKQKAIRGDLEMFNSTGYQLQQNADGTWEYVMPEGDQTSSTNQNAENLGSKSEVRMTNASLQDDRLHGTVHQHPKLGTMDNVITSTIIAKEKVGTTHQFETANTIYLIEEEEWLTKPMTEVVEQTTTESNIDSQAAEVGVVEASSKTIIDKKAVTAAAVGVVAGAGTIAAIKQKATEQIEIPEQVIEKVRQSGIQPDDLLKFADFNRDGLIDAAELTGAITAATGIAIPFAVLKTIIDKVDSDGDSALNREELELLWVEMGIPLTKIEDTLEGEIDTALEEISEHETIPEEVVEESIDEEILEEVEEEVEEESHEQHIEGTDFEEVELTDGIDTRLEEVLIQLEEARLTSERNSIIETNGFNHRVTIRIQRVDKTILGKPEYRGGLTFTGELDGGPYSALLEMPVAMSEQLSSLDEGDTIIAIAHLSKWKSGLKRAVLEGVEIIK